MKTEIKDCLIVHWLATFAKEEILRIVCKEILCKEFDAKNAKKYLCKLMLRIR